MISAFRSKLVVEDDGGYPYVLVSPLVYTSALLVRDIVVPAGFKTDLFSIPGVVTNLLPKSEKGDQAAVIHDFLYQTAPYGANRGQCDAILREAMEVCGVGRVRRNLIYAGVRAGGWSPWGQYRRAEQAPRG